MMKTTCLLALVAIMAIGAVQIQDVAAIGYIGNPGHNGVSVSPTIASFQHFNGYATTSNTNPFHAVASDKVTDQTGFKIGTHLLTTQSSFVVDSDIEIASEQQFHQGGAITVIANGEEVAILTQDEYIDLFGLNQGRDSNGAPSMQGFNTRDADRVEFSGAEDVIFVMSNTEIHILAGQATSQYVVVSFDGYPIDVINTGVTQDILDTMRGNSIGIGGQIVDIPFEAYYHVTDEGQLISLGDGAPNVWRDLEQMRIFNEGQGNEVSERESGL